MASDVFLKIADLQGESSDEQHLNEIEIQSICWDVTQTTNPLISAGGSLTTGKSAFGTVRVLKNTDRSSPRLYLACAGGEHYRDATITMRRAIANQQKTYLVFKLTDVLVARVAFAERSRELGNEEVALSYAKIEWTYTRFNADGTAAGNVAAGWNLSTNSAI